MAAHIFLGRLLSFTDRPKSRQDANCYKYWEKGALVVENGGIVWIGDLKDIPIRFEAYTRTDYSDKLIMAGFIDAHTHFPQIGVIASYGTQLLDWLNEYTFPQEAKYVDDTHSLIAAKQFLNELLINGVTTAAVFGSSHKQSVDAFFQESANQNLRMIAGKVLMDRHAPGNLCDTVQSGYDDSAALIADWHGKGRLSYAVTPRFAITSSSEQMEAAGALLDENPDCYMQTHLSESKAEIVKVASLHPESLDYLDVYDGWHLIGERSLLGHCIHLTEREKRVMVERGAHAVFCPTSNLFLGSGLFDLKGLADKGVSIAVGSDVGAGTSYSMLATMADAYKVCQLQGVSLNPLESFYRITLGNAEALLLEDKIGSLDVGSEADFVVLDSSATSAMKIRMMEADSIEDELFVLQTLGDDRAVTATYVAGELRRPIEVFNMNTE